MSLRVSVAVTVTDIDEDDLVRVVRVDTSINPNPGDQHAAPLLAASLLERIVGEAGRDALERLRELGVAMENVENA